MRTKHGKLANQLSVVLIIADADTVDMNLGANIVASVDIKEKLNVENLWLTKR